MLNYDKVAEEIIELFETKRQVDSNDIYDYFVKCKYNNKIKKNQQENLCLSILRIANKKEINITTISIRQLENNTIVVYFDIKN